MYCSRIKPVKTIKYVIYLWKTRCDKINKMELKEYGRDGARTRVLPILKIVQSCQKHVNNELFFC